MAKRCTFIHPNGKPCRRWARYRENFCYHHMPDGGQQERESAEDLPPLLRLTSAEDVFDVVRETLNAVRLGRIRPGQAYAVGYLVDVWLRIRKELNFYQRERGLYRQLLTEQVECEEIADEALADGAPVLPNPKPKDSTASLSPEDAQQLERVSAALKAQLNKSAKKTAISLLKDAGRLLSGVPPAKKGSNGSEGKEN